MVAMARSTAATVAPVGPPLALHRRPAALPQRSAVTKLTVTLRSPAATVATATVRHLAATEARPQAPRRRPRAIPRALRPTPGPTVTSPVAMEATFIARSMVRSVGQVVLPPAAAPRPLPVKIMSMHAITSVVVAVATSTAASVLAASAAWPLLLRRRTAPTLPAIRLPTLMQPPLAVVVVMAVVRARVVVTAPQHRPPQAQAAWAPAR